MEKFNFEKISRKRNGEQIGGFDYREKELASKKIAGTISEEEKQEFYKLVSLRLRGEKYSLDVDTLLDETKKQRFYCQKSFYESKRKC